jgi:hypothetical protein
MASTMTIDPPKTDNLLAALDRARADFFEMPGLQLTTAQGTLLWSLDSTTCEEVLEILATARFLVKSEKAIYSRP